MRVQLSPLVAAAAVVLALHVAPTSAYAQAKTSVCKDGTTSTTAGRGACSGHGGVDAAKTPAATKVAKSAPKDAPKAAKSATNPPAATAMPMKTTPAAKKEVAANTKAKNDAKDATGATAQCKDGTYSHAAGHRGACSNHGGVAKFLK